MILGAESVASSESRSSAETSAQPRRLVVNVASSQLTTAEGWRRACDHPIETLHCGNTTPQHTLTYGIMAGRRENNGGDSQLCQREVKQHRPAGSRPAFSISRLPEKKKLGNNFSKKRQLNKNIRLGIIHPP